MKKILLLLMLPAALCLPAYSQTTFYTVDQLIETALANSADLAEKEAAWKASSYRVKEAISRSAPTVDFESNLSYITNPDTLTVEAGALGEMVLPGPLVISMPEEDVVFEMTGNTYYDFKLVLDQPIFTWGKILNSIKAAKEGAGAALEDRGKTEDQIKTEILINSHVLHYLKEIELALSKQNELVKRLEGIASDSLSNGMILRTEYLEVENSLRESDLAIRKISQQIKSTTLNLTYLTGIELSPVMIRTEPLETGDRESWENLFGKALSENRDLAMFRHKVQADEYKKKIRKGEFYFKPDLAFHMELGYSGSLFPFIQEGWEDDDKGNLTLSLAIRSPLGDGGAMYFAGEAAEYDEQASRASYEAAMEQIEQFIRQSLMDMELNEINIDYYRERLLTDERIIEQKEKEWLSGYGDEKEYLKSQIDMYARQVSLFREMISLGTTGFQLDHITGSVKQ
ncbi:TolC family protein [Spirochaeta isovalerica]|uniref:Outer membrane protein TolC n=1 Tax=Spirochaeta isovalerica TaxID=150 RepID=A0A841R783_9SPIO|nr:TolC family protein [Spirochaeta isovalerica]MBB6479693.1 outer membrane protein TolC [Spirochaeta isovalerica]